MINGSLTVRDSFFDENSAQNGGAIDNDPGTWSSRAARFLKERVRIIDRPTTESLPPILPEGCPQGFLGFRFKGRDYRISKAKDVLIQVFEVLSEHDPAFPERFAALPTHGHKRRYLARTKQELYPDRSDRCDLSVRLKSGWFLGANYGRYEIKKLLE